MAQIIATTDLPSSVTDVVDPAQLAIMVGGANASASRVAPCLVAADPAPTADQLAEAKLVLLGAITRWSEAGAGAVTQESAGPWAHTIDTRQQRTGYRLWPSEIEQLQDICSTGASSGAFSVDTAPSLSGVHLPWCSLNFGANYCSCGVDISGGVPLYEGGILS